MKTTRIKIGKHEFEAWIADTAATRTTGLMFVPAERLADMPDGAHRGMLFVFDGEKALAFYMRNTITPLDIAFINSKGTIVRRHTMKPLDEHTYPSGRPARYALEVRANLLTELGIKTGDHVEIPGAALKNGR